MMAMKRPKAIIQNKISGAVSSINQNSGQRAHCGLLTMDFTQFVWSKVVPKVATFVREGCQRFSKVVKRLSYSQLLGRNNATFVSLTT